MSETPARRSRMSESLLADSEPGRKIVEQEKQETKLDAAKEKQETKLDTAKRYNAPKTNEPGTELPPAIPGEPRRPL